MCGYVSVFTRNVSMPLHLQGHFFNCKAAFLCWKQPMTQPNSLHYCARCYITVHLTVVCAPSSVSSWTFLTSHLYNYPSSVLGSDIFRWCLPVQQFRNLTVLIFCVLPHISNSVSVQTLCSTWGSSPLLSPLFQSGLKHQEWHKDNRSNGKSSMIFYLHGSLFGLIADFPFPHWHPKPDFMNEEEQPPSENFYTKKGTICQGKLQIIKERIFTCSMRE